MNFQLKPSPDDCHPQWCDGTCKSFIECKARAKENRQRPIRVETIPTQVPVYPELESEKDVRQRVWRDIKVSLLDLVGVAALAIGFALVFAALMVMNP